MVAHWRRELRDKRHAAERRRVWVNLVINAIGASATVTALAVIIVAKFAQGGWITIVAIPCVIVLHKAIKRYYDDIDDQLRDNQPLKFHRSEPPIVLVIVREWNLMADKVLGLAMELSSDVTAVRLAALEGPDVKSEERKLREQWAKNVEEPARAAHFPHPPQLAFLSAPYRRIHAPFLKLIKEIEDKNPDRTIAVLIPELVKQHWWDYLLSAQHARRLRSAVLAYGGPRVVVIAVPWYLTPPTIEDAMTEEEAAEPFRIRNVFRFRLRRSRRKQA